jgi:hypothetical protein
MLLVIIFDLLDIFRGFTILWNRMIPFPNRSCFDAKPLTVQVVRQGEVDKGRGGLGKECCRVERVAGLRSTGLRSTENSAKNNNGSH